MEKVSRKIAKMFASAMSILLCIAMLTACGEKTDSSSSAKTKAIVPHEATQEQIDMIIGERQQALEGKVISSKVDQKFVNTNYMLTGLVNSDCTIIEDAENGLLITVPSENAAIQINLVPGIQNAAKAVSNLQQLITTNYSQEGTGGTFQSSLLGYNATIIPFSANVDNEVINGFASAFIANQSLYTLNLLYYSTATDNELELLQKIIPSLQIIKPAAVDTSTKKATYADPYASYKTYDPYLYYYVSGECTYDDYLAAFTDYYASIDISSWDSLPYEYYTWYDGDYSTYTEEDYVADWDYYDEEDYWSWGWDEEDDWAFYDEYEDYYSDDYYDELDNYYEEADYEYEDYTADEEFEFTDDFDSTWEDVDLGSYEESDYEYEDYYDDFYYESDDAEVYEDE